MWAAFKALPILAKLGIAFGILALFAATIGSTYYVAYNKGLNVSAVEIQKYKTKVSDLTNKLTTAQGKVDVQVVTKYLEGLTKVVEKEGKTITVVKEVVPEQFKFSKGWVYSYNQSVLGADVDPALAADTSPSSISDAKVLIDTIIPNNYKSRRNIAKLDSLQEWIVNTEKSREEVTNER